MQEIYANFNNIAQSFTDFVNDPIVQISKKQVITLSQILEIIFVCAVAYGFYLLVKTAMSIQVKRKKIRSAQGNVLLQLFRYVIVIFSFFYAINTLGYSFSYLFVGSTALLVGLGFGLQQLFLDLLSGVILLIDRNVNLGDVIRLETFGDLRGKIIHIGLRTTQLQTIDNKILVVPNSKMMSSGMQSLMRDRGSARFRVSINVGYKADMDKAVAIMIKAVDRDVRVDKDPEPSVIIKDFMDSSVQLEVRFWMKEIFNTENILSDLRFEILKEFHKNNIEIPFPQRVIHNAK